MDSIHIGNCRHFLDEFGFDHRYSKDSNAKEREDSQIMKMRRRILFGLVGLSMEFIAMNQWSDPHSHARAVYLSWFGAWSLFTFGLTFLDLKKDFARLESFTKHFPIADLQSG